MRTIGYNSQRNNYSFAGKFSAWSQCFSTAAWMFMSFYTPTIEAEDDNGLMNYIDDVEAVVGKPGIGEKIKNKYSWITGNTSLWWLTQKEGIENYLWKAGVIGQAIFKDGDYLISDLPNLLEKGPIILGTNKLGGLPGGHIILLIDYDKFNYAFLVNDSFGDAKYHYVNQNGNSIIYQENFLKQFIAIKNTDKCRIIYWKK